MYHHIWFVQDLRLIYFAVGIYFRLRINQIILSLPCSGFCISLLKLVVKIVGISVRIRSIKTLYIKIFFDIQYNKESLASFSWGNFWSLLICEEGGILFLMWKDNDFKVMEGNSISSCSNYFSRSLLPLSLFLNGAIILQQWCYSGSCSVKCINYLVSKNLRYLKLSEIRASVSNSVITQPGLEHTLV